LEKCCEHRKPFFLAFDEAQHLMSLSGMSFEDLMDWLKSLANLSKVLICLYGTYEMYDLLDLSDQLMRRSKIIHLRRYTDNKSDFINFQNTILSFQKNLPFKEEFNLLAHSDYLYERTAGCVGNLYDWLSAAVNIAIFTSESYSLEYKHLRMTVPLTALQAAKMNKSITEDEKIFYQNIGDDNEEEFNEIENKGNSLSSKHNNNQSNKKNSKINGSKKGKRRRVGKRNPERDSIGSNNINV
jgi:hypothetical protein